MQNRFSLARLAVCLFVPSLACFGQAFDTFVLSYTVTLSSESRAVSIQLPATGTNVTEILGATVNCAAACDMREETNSAASVHNGTTIIQTTIVAFNPETTPSLTQSNPKVDAFFGSAIPAGTPLGPTWTLPAGSIVPFAGGRVLSGTGGEHNYIMRLIGPYSGKFSVQVTVRVRR